MASKRARATLILTARDGGSARAAGTFLPLVQRESRSLVRYLRQERHG